MKKERTMKSDLKIITSCLFGLIMALSACSIPGIESVTQPESTIEAVSQPEVQIEPITNNTPTEKTAEIAPTSTSEANIITEATAAVIVLSHKTQPGSPIYTQHLPGECNTGFNYQPIGYQVRSPCDVWGTNLLERAVSVDMSSFYHYIDILSAQVGKGGDWYYASFDLFGAGIPTDGAMLTYFFELDLDQNGRGDILLAVQDLDLYSSEWTVSGVRVWRDLNGDVGGQTAVRPDTQSGDGYETLISDQGLGDDPDLAWARRAPNRPQRIEFAFKPILLDGKSSFMWWAGAMRGDFNPGDFDLVDNHSETMLYEIDTTCGWFCGYEQGYSIKKCYIAPEPTKRERESESAPEICVKPPHPDPSNNCWIWFPDKCQWECWN
jgi:hypothetical protein